MDGHNDITNFMNNVACLAYIFYLNMNRIQLITWFLRIMTVNMWLATVHLRYFSLSSN